VQQRADRYLAEITEAIWLEMEARGIQAPTSKKRRPR
jgi:hypothetical protein